MEEEVLSFEEPQKPEMENVIEIIPNTEDFDEPEKARAIIQNLSLSVGDTIKDDGDNFIINPKMVLRGNSPKAYEKEVKLFKELCTPFMISKMTEQMNKKRKFGNKQRDKFYNSFCKKLDIRLKVKSLKDSEAVIYFTQEDSFKNCVAGLHNCVYHLLDIEAKLNEFKLAWRNKPIPNTQEWREENDGEYKVLTDSEADEEVRNYFEGDEYNWKCAVESDYTTLGFDDWVEQQVDMGSRGEILSFYDSCEENEEIDGTNYYIYRTN